MNRQMQLVRAVALKADAFYGTAEKFGARMARPFSHEHGHERGRAQITGLEAIANSALKASDVLDYVKKQTARHEEWYKDNLGPDLLSFLTDGGPDSLYKQRGAIEKSLSLDAVERQQVTVMLYREFIRQVAAHYQFEQRRLQQERAKNESVSRG